MKRFSNVWKEKINLILISTLNYEFKRTKATKIHKKMIADKILKEFKGILLFLAINRLFDPQEQLQK